MLKNTVFNFFCILYLFIPFFSIAQKNITISVCGQQANVPFRRDTVVSFNANKLVQLKVIEPISLSKARVQIQFGQKVNRSLDSKIAKILNSTFNTNDKINFKIVNGNIDGGYPAKQKL